MNRPYFHPDDSGMLNRDQFREQQERNRRQNNHGGNYNGPGGHGGGMLAPFLPGDKSLLAEQLSFGYGGKPQAYMRQFNQMYKPMPMNFNFGSGGLGALNGGMGGAPVPVQYGKPYETYSFADPKMEQLMRGRR